MSSQQLDRLYGFLLNSDLLDDFFLDFEVVALTALCALIAGEDAFPADDEGGILWGGYKLFAD